VSLGKILRKLRLSKKLNQSDLAKLLNIDRTTYGKYETGDSSPDYGKLLKMANFFEVSTDYLLGRTDNICFGNMTAAELPARYGETKAAPPSVETFVTNDVLNAELEKIREELKELKQVLKIIYDSTGQQTSFSHEEDWTEHELQKIKEYKSFIRNQRQGENFNLHFISSLTTQEKSTPPDTKPTKKPR